MKVDNPDTMESDDANEQKAHSPMSELEPELKRRKAARSHGLIPQWVSRWKLYHVEKHFHIFYDETYLLSPTEVFQKIPSLPQLTDEQNKWLSSLHEFMEIDSSWDECRYDYETFRGKCREQKKKTGPPTLVTSQGIIDPKWFLNAIYELLHTIEREQRNKSIRKLHIKEEHFMHLIMRFGEICCLNVRRCGSGSIWYNLKGVAEVISIPDYRFSKFNESEDADEKPDTLVSVVEVKSKKSSRGEFPSEEQRPRRDSSNSDISDVSSIASSKSSFTELNESYTEIKPQVLDDIDESILGQHAGELLLDMYKFRQDEKGEVITLPGMIFDGTVVYVTLLEMSREHLVKLEKNQQLEEKDRATIYVSLPCDLLNRLKRKLLLANILRLSNYVS